MKRSAGILWLGVAGLALAAAAYAVVFGHVIPREIPLDGDLVICGHTLRGPITALYLDGCSMAGR